MVAKAYPTTEDLVRPLTARIEQLERANDKLTADVANLARENGHLLDDLYEAREAIRELQALNERGREDI